MASEVWLGLSERERQVLRHALSAYARGEAADRTAVNALVEKIVSAPPRPDIAIGVYGGQIQVVKEVIDNGSHVMNSMRH
jgi:hypothetical protein